MVILGLVQYGGKEFIMKQNVVRLSSFCLSILIAVSGLISCSKREISTPESKTEETEVSETPLKTTECPEETTKGQEKPTKSSEETTKKPEKPTQKPEETDGLEYFLLSDGTYAVGGGTTKNLTEIVIPETYNGSAVTVIKESAFEDFSNLMTVSIPDSVTSIENSSFRNCSGLVSVVIPNNVMSIGARAFHDCTSLTSIIIPDSVKSIEAQTFANCTGLISVKISNGVTSIGEVAFGGCFRLTSVIIPNSVEMIGERAFCNCTSLTNITIPDSVIRIEDYTFWNCTGLTNITIPDSMTSISDGAFRNCTGLTSITIPNSMTDIGIGAFHGCYKLVEVYNKSSLEIAVGSGEYGYVGYYAKAVYTGTTYASKLSIDLNGYILYKDVDIVSLIGYIGNATNLTLPEGITEINCGAFYGCTNLMSITIPDSVLGIGDDAFSGCCKLVEVYNKSTLPIAVKSREYGGVGYYAKAVYTESYTSKLSVDRDGYILYTDGDIVSLIGYIGNKADLTLPSGITEIYPYAFFHCLDLKSVVIPDGMAIIGRMAFDGCSGLTSVTMGQDVTNIGMGAFNGCDGLTGVYITDLVKWLGISYGVSLKEVQGAIMSGYISNPLAYAHNLYLNGALVTDLVIPDGVTSVGMCAFMGCDKLTSITIPNSVTSIGGYAFSGCENLVSITLPFVGKNVDQTGIIDFEGIFDGVPASLKMVIITGGTSIWRGAFYGCSGLTSITIPSSVTSIGENAFSGCTSLTSIWFDGTKELWNAILKESDWNYNTGLYTIHCTDGDIGIQNQ